MILKTLIVGQLDVNCYIVGCEQTKEAVIIDPGGDAADILALIARLGVKPKYVICTHGHGDHIGALDEVSSATSAQVLIHSADAEMLTNPQKNFSAYFGQSIILKALFKTVADGEIIKVGGLELGILHTPGHTQGGICIQVEDVVFTGDTLFAGSVGRSDLPGGNHSQLIQEIKAKLLTLPGQTKVFPGHGPDSLIEKEEKHNSFLK